MHELQLLLVAHGLAPRLDRPDRLAGILSVAADMEVYPNSISGNDRVIYFLARSPYEKHLGLAFDATDAPQAAHDFQGTVEAYELQGVQVSLKLCGRTHGNAVALRRHLPFAAPRCIGLARSFGFGDRLGLATPGHVRTVEGSGLRPFFAQQSVREMGRTARTPEQVLDDVTWGVFQEGFRDGFGADADHLKTAEDIDACVAAGFTLFTIDPGQYVDDTADAASPAELAEKFRNAPWQALESSPTDCRAAYLGRAADVAEGLRLEPTEEDLMRAAVKYGAAVAHTARLYRRLVERKGEEPFELEVSVDETASPTSPFEHYFVAAELRRLAVRWVSLAPRFVGEFEKGVDYRGDLCAFERSFAQHAAIARAAGPYKLSIHSGSDKFAIYPIAARLAGDLIHVKTAGTSYLEALRVVVTVARGLFREILDFARECYDADRASYHVSADAWRVPSAASLKDSQLLELLDQHDARQVLHVTYGSVLGARNEDGSCRFRDRIFNILRDHEDLYSRFLQRHLGRHVAPFRKGNTSAV
jgi:sugar phosphate isomerase/epimerase